jgi:two-component system sensor histidine kinase ChvG
VSERPGFARIEPRLDSGDSHTEPDLAARRDDGVAMRATERLKPKRRPAPVRPVRTRDLPSADDDDDAAEEIPAAPPRKAGREVPEEPREKRKARARADSAEAQRRLRRRRRLTPLTRRILAVNVLALVIPVVGLLYLGEYRENLISTELDALTNEAELFAGALGATGVVTDPIGGEERLVTETTRHTVRRLVEASQRRARLFAPDGALLADSNRLMGPGGQVEIEVLPPIQATGFWE